VYRPGEAATASLILIPGAVQGGRRHPRLVDLARTLSRARFVVAVPQIGELQGLQVRADDASEIVAVLERFGRDSYERPLGLMAVSYTVGPALIAATRPEVASEIDFFVGIGGYDDVVDLIRFATTGYYRAESGGQWRWRRPNPYGKWVFVLSNAQRVRDAEDRRTLEAMAWRKLEDPSADTAGLAEQLGSVGSAVYRLITNDDPERVAALIDELPRHIRQSIDALDLDQRPLHQLPTQVLLVHGREDNIIPPTHSQRLAERIGRDQADLYLIDGMSHVGTRPSLLGKLQMWQAVYRLLELRDAGD